MSPLRSQDGADSQSTPTCLPHRSPPLIHLPLNLPPQDQHTLTPWLDIKLNLASLLPLFKSLPRALGHDKDKNKRQRFDTELPSGSFSQVSYVRVYANCRLRRIWFVSTLSLVRHEAALMVRAQMARRHWIRLGSRMNGLCMPVHLFPLQGSICIHSVSSKVVQSH